ncbi:MAG: lipid A deacylase LpxR family protein [Bacteroidetes bacterium]|nr:lipid A deacylase LpxR family protein [Bacteroidota bacterium]
MKNFVSPAPAVVIDHPAAVLFNSLPENHSSANAVKGNIIEKILSPYHIAIIAPKSGNVEFLKQDGRKVQLDLLKLRSHYDVILFNTINDPIPCFIKDLRKTATHCFTATSVNEPRNIPPGNTVNAAPANNTAIQTFLTADSLQLIHRKKNRNISIIVTDVSSVPLSMRNMNGIQWVENRLDKNSYFGLTFENDLITYNNTDRYFTNGVSFTLQAPWMSRLRSSQLMLPYRHTSAVAYSMILVQNMYTPKDTRIAPTFIDDRPYSSYLYLGYRKTTTDPFRKVRLTNEADLGYIGPYSPGAYLQTIVHETFPTNDKPQGWETQIRTDIILNYNLKVEKAIIQKENLVLAAAVQTKAGTLYSQAGLGIRLQAGRQSPYFGSVSDKKQDAWQYFFFMESNANVIAYDATLEGGVFNKDNIFTIKSSNISRLVGNSECGIQVRYKGTGLELAQHYLSPEYKHGLWHKWGRISLIFKL